MEFRTDEIHAVGVLGDMERLANTTRAWCFLFERKSCRVDRLQPREAGMVRANSLWLVDLCVRTSLRRFCLKISSGSVPRYT